MVLKTKEKPGIVVLEARFGCGYPGTSGYYLSGKATTKSAGTYIII